MTSAARATVIHRTFTQQDLDDFGSVSGGTGLIHTDPAYAATTRFGRTVVHGLLLLAVIEEVVGRARPDWQGTGEVEVRFVAPVGTGETVRFLVEPSGPDLRIEVSGDAGPVVTGTARPTSASRRSAAPTGDRPGPRR